MSSDVLDLMVTSCTWADGFRPSLPSLRHPTAMIPAMIPAFRRSKKMMVFPILESSSIGDSNRCFEEWTINENDLETGDSRLNMLGNQASVIIFCSHAVYFERAVSDDGFNQLGLHYLEGHIRVVEPLGAFYCFVYTGNTGLKSNAFLGS